MTPRILLVGATGFLGRAFAEHFRRLGWSLYLTTHRDPHSAHFLDLAAPQLERLPGLAEVSHLLICGAWSRLADCEREPELSRRVNLEGPLQLLRSLCPKGVRAIVFSTDYVFDGLQAPYTESAAPSPCNHYGAQKAALESALLSEFPTQVLILRLSKVYEPLPSSPTLLGEMLQNLRQGRPLRVATDQRLNPVACSDVLSAATALIRAGQSGLWNLAGPEPISRWQLALKLAERLKLDRQLIQPIRLRDLQEPFVRPADTVLNIDRLRATLPNWRPLSLEQAILRLQEAGP